MNENNNFNNEQPAYQIPQQPVYAPPVQPQAPQQPAYQVPQEPAYAQPVQPQAPQEPAYAQPVQPQAPQEPVYAQPIQPQAPQEPVYAQPVQPQQPVYNNPPAYDPYAGQNYNQQAYQSYGAPAQAPNDTTTLVFGIVALVAALTFYFSPAGIVFGILAKKKAEGFMSLNGEVGGTIKTGKILGTVGFIVGIVMSAILSIVIFAALVG